MSFLMLKNVIFLYNLKKFATFATKINKITLNKYEIL